jgi:collagenase-like PrtC family protease
VQTQSSSVHCLIGEAPELHAAGIGLLRISPQSRDTTSVLAAWRRVLDGDLAADGAREACLSLSPATLANGFWRGQAGRELA